MPSEYPKLLADDVERLQRVEVPPIPGLRGEMDAVFLRIEAVVGEALGDGEEIEIGNVEVAGHLRGGFVDAVIALDVVRLGGEDRQDAVIQQRLNDLREVFVIDLHVHALDPVGAEVDEHDRRIVHARSLMQFRENVLKMGPACMVALCTRL